MIPNEYIDYFKKESGADNVQVIEVPGDDPLKSVVKIAFSFSDKKYNELFNSLSSASRILGEVQEQAKILGAIKTIKDFLT